MSEHWKPGDRLRGAGTPTPGQPYSIPTADEQGRIVEMHLTDIVMLDAKHYEATVDRIEPYDADR